MLAISTIRTSIARCTNTFLTAPKWERSFRSPYFCSYLEPANPKAPFQFQVQRGLHSKASHTDTGLRKTQLTAEDHQHFFAAHTSIHNHYQADWHLEQSELGEENWQSHQNYLKLVLKEKSQLGIDELTEVIRLYELAIEENNNPVWHNELNNNLDKYKLFHRIKSYFSFLNLK